MSEPTPELPTWFINLLAMHSFEAHFDGIDNDGPAYQVLCIKCGAVEYRLLHCDHSEWTRERWIESTKQHRLYHECNSWDRA